MKEIQLTKNQVALVDDEDYELVSQYKWFTFKSGYNEKVYALLCVGFVRWENSVYTVLAECVGIERRVVLF